MTSTLTSLPTLLRSSGGSSYVVPATLHKASIKLTLNLCSAPAASYNQSDVNIFTAYTNTSFTYGCAIEGGFANLTVPVVEDGSAADVAISFAPPSGQRGSDYTYEIGVVSSDSGDPWHVLDKVPLFAYEDSDNTSALLTSPTWPSNLLAAAPGYIPLISDTSMVREDLANSSCYIASLSSLVPASRINSSTTTRGVVELSMSEGGSVNETLRGGKRTQYQITGLQTGSNYSVWGMQNNSFTQGSSRGSRLFTQQFFVTKSGESSIRHKAGQTESVPRVCLPMLTFLSRPASFLPFPAAGTRDKRPILPPIADNCRLVYDIPFCPAVAYAVPSPPSLDTPSLLDLYNSSIATSLSGFNTTLSTFSCSAPVRENQGMYSYVRTCEQCMQAYTTWVCAIRMPRCTDYNPSGTQGQGGNATNSDSTKHSPGQLTTFQRTSANDSRTPFLPNSAFPYSEVPPCIDVCSLVPASCPPLISSTFNCPLEGVTLENSYARPFLEQIAFNNVQGGDDPAWLAKTLAGDGPDTRAQDRFGNVVCNDLDVITLTTRRRWSGSTVVNAARRLSASRSEIAVALSAASLPVLLLLL